MIVPLADVGGSTAPTEFDPAEWEVTALVIDATFDQGALVGSALWQGSNDTSDAPADTGTIDVSGMSESVGSFVLSSP